MGLELAFSNVHLCPQMPSLVRVLFILMDRRVFYQSSIQVPLSGIFHTTSPELRFMPYISQSTTCPIGQEVGLQSTIGKYNVNCNVVAVVTPSGTFVGPYSPTVIQELEAAGFIRNEGIGVPHIYNRDMWPRNEAGDKDYYLVRLLFEACKKFELECKRRKDGEGLPTASL
ncbi:MAG: hypothetical protein JNK24_01375 [Alphaproteobacteria bacterium]|nr:hypothetical protein [Alphaproteobacteria bacterium]